MSRDLATPAAALSPLRAIERELEAALAEIRFGSIEIVIHDGRVVQIERRERVRFFMERVR